MKAKSLFTIGFILLGLSACSSEKVSHNATTLPIKARDIISQNFASAISLVEEEKSMGTVKEYEVTLTDGSEITFTNSGEWKSVETPNNKPVPSGMVPTAIIKYVNAKHAGAYVVGIEKNKKGFEVELSNGVEIQFDKTGNFMNYDN